MALVGGTDVAAVVAAVVEEVVGDGVAAEAQDTSKSVAMTAILVNFKNFADMIYLS